MLSAGQTHRVAVSGARTKEKHRLFEFLFQGVHELVFLFMMYLIIIVFVFCGKLWVGAVSVSKHSSLPIPGSCTWLG